MEINYELIADMLVDYMRFSDKEHSIMAINDQYEAIHKLHLAKATDEQSPIYYMRDNHTYKRLSDDVSVALVEIEQEFNNGYTHGMLCSKRHGFKYVHAAGEKHRMLFLNLCREALIDVNSRIQDSHL